MKPAELAVRAATRAYGETVQDIRPLDLPPADAASFGPAVTAGPPWAELPRRRRGGRAHRVRGRAHRVRGWAAPVGAAAAVIALAISLIVAQGLSHEGHAAPAGPSVTSGVPRYYVALDQPDKKQAALDDVLIGDAFTGRTLATITPPAGATFRGVTGAADDRTFIVDTMKIAHNGNPSLAITWYLLRVTPGTAPGYRLTRLPIPDMSAWGVQGIALSRSGTELALALVRANGQSGIFPFELQTYSVTTGKLLRAWSTNQGGMWGPVIFVPGTQDDLLSWADNDTTLAFPAVRGERLLNTTAPGDNLIADSRPAGSVSWEPSRGCLTEPLLSPDGKTAVCTSVTGHASAATGPLAFTSGSSRGTSREVLRWLAYSVSAPEKTRTTYQVTVQAPNSDSSMAAILWVSPSGNTMIVDWALSPTTAFTRADSHVGVVSNGRFTPLRMASASFFQNGWPTIAW